MITQIGPHRVRHGNVMDSVGLAELMRADKADIIYSDPPWGQGNLKYWGTMNRKMTGQEVEQPELGDFINQIFTVVTRYLKPNGVFLIEYGVRWQDQIKSYGKAHGLFHHGMATPVYTKPPLPLHLHLFSRSPTPPPAASADYFNSVTGTTGFECVRRASEPFKMPGGIVFDMCCGLGYSAKMARLWGMAFRGNELNKARLEKTIARLK